LFFFPEEEEEEEEESEEEQRMGDRITVQDPHPPWRHGICKPVRPLSRRK
jgi:hypothetical protein